MQATAPVSVRISIGEFTMLRRNKPGTQSTWDRGSLLIAARDATVQRDKLQIDRGNFALRLTLCQAKCVICRRNVRSSFWCVQPSKGR